MCKPPTGSFPRQLYKSLFHAVPQVHGRFSGIKRQHAGIFTQACCFNDFIDASKTSGSSEKQGFYSQTAPYLIDALLFSSSVL